MGYGKENEKKKILWIYLSMAIGAYWALYSPQEDEIALVCVPIPGNEIVKSAEHVIDIEADYNPHLYFTFTPQVKQLLETQYFEFFY